MIQSRINRVINNHQMSCAHNENYLYILKGFEDVLNKYSVPIEKIQFGELKPNTNYYILYEEAYNHLDRLEKILREHKLSVWTVEFNLVPNYFIANSENNGYKEILPIDSLYLVTYKEIQGLNPNHKICIFNQINPLIGIVKEDERKDSIYEYVEVYQNLE